MLPFQKHNRNNVSANSSCLIHSVRKELMIIKCIPFQITIDNMNFILQFRKPINISCQNKKNPVFWLLRVINYFSCKIENKYYFTKKYIIPGPNYSSCIFIASSLMKLSLKFRENIFNFLSSLPYISANTSFFKFPVKFWSN